ncbi:MAG: hypothetical protein HY047_13490 [Acidobacteria bacterium]|nr:hypothetical protein [Acidobacteriota bacterium]
MNISIALVVLISLLLGIIGTVVGIAKKRVVFYSILIGMFWFFFLLHLNGLFAFTYWWALERVNGTRSFLPQVTAAFLSANIIFSVPVFLFELKLRLGSQGELRNK